MEVGRTRRMGLFRGELGCLLFLLLCLDPVRAADEKGKCEGKNMTCEGKGLIITAWTPTPPDSTGDLVCRAIVYMVLLFYMFLGVSIIADKFMAAIETITSKEKEVKVRKVTGEEYTILVRVWNETVSNLTLMALGSSAPEILLSIIEIVGNKFEAGKLGPGTIVGSAAFNLFIIIAICISVVPTDELRKIKHIYVFWVTVVWSIFAYVWLYIILHDNKVKLWEAILTFLFFPLTVITAWIADRKMFGLGHRYMGLARAGTFSRPHSAQSPRGTKSAGPSRSTNGTTITNGDIELSVPNSHGKEVEYLSPEARHYEEQRAQYINIFKELRSKHPEAPIELLEQMAEKELIKRAPKSRAFYRIKATRQMIGAGNVVTKKIQIVEEEHKKQEEERSRAGTALGDYGIVAVKFDPGHYTCMEDVGTMFTTVVCTRDGVNVPCIVEVDYKTEEGSAGAVSDFLPVEGTLTFHPDESRKNIGVQIVDNDIYEEDEDFKVLLTGIRAYPASRGSGSRGAGEVPCKLGTPSIATVLIVDNDHGGAFGFETEKFQAVESQGDIEIAVVRTRGARGSVGIPYKSVNGTAKAGLDYLPVEGVLYFKDEQTEAIIAVPIVNDDQYEKTEDFYIELGEPLIQDKDYGGISSEEQEVAELGKPVLSSISRCKVVIKESTEFKSFVDKMVKTAGSSVVVGSSSWKQQFIDAVSVSGGGDDDDEMDVPPSCFDYVMHALTLPWKLLFALVPPTDYLGGWLSFVVSISMIGLMTAFIGDLATQFGCTVGLDDSITAISIVALGTSLPDTFASKTAALSDDNADSSIVNVTGSNAVNVYLGLGVAWLIAAIYHTIDGTDFNVESGSLGFSVSLFCIGAVLCVIVLQVRRYYLPKGELGGHLGMKYISAGIFILIWLMYLIFSILVTYCIIIPGY